MRFRVQNAPWKLKLERKLVILFLYTLLSIFCKLGGILLPSYETENPCGVDWGRFCMQNRMCKRAFRNEITGCGNSRLPPDGQTRCGLEPNYSSRHVRLFGRVGSVIT